jgi:hypothetical protein
VACGLVDCESVGDCNVVACGVWCVVCGVPTVFVMSQYPARVIVL